MIRFSPKSQNKLLHTFSLFAVISIMLCPMLMPARATAAVDYNKEIKRLQAEQDANAGNRSALQTSALTLEQKLAALRSSIASLDGQIQAGQRSRAEITTKLAANTEQIAREQSVLGQILRQMYIDNDVSMLEKVASSKNLSDYVEKEQYSLAMQSKVKQTMDHITALKQEQQAQKTLIDKLIADNTAMQAQTASEKQEVAGLLAMNQEQQASYTQSIATASVEINDLQLQQAEENMRFQREQAALAEAARQKAASNPSAARSVTRSAAPEAAPANVRGVNGQSYPYSGAPFPNESIDPWGMYQRQCVSYTAWAVTASGRHMPYWGGRGNAKQWDDNARSAGIPVDSNPRVGDVAVSNRGTYGHVMYVDGVNGDGSISISQYNAAWDGRYSTARIFPADLVFIHF